MSTAASPMATARGRVLLLVTFGIAMGWLEAVIVAVLRVLLGIAPGEGYPPFPAMMDRFRTFDRLLAIEQGRELATLLMLFSLGMLAAPRWPQRLGAFLLAFGVWDLAYYVALRLLIGWPRHIGDMDLLFLVPPHPLWVQPVWLPMLAASAMIGLGARLLAAGDERNRRASGGGTAA